jgi:hypothetical protein
MAEVRINPEQLQEAVNASLKRALVREPGPITGPILIGIIAYPDDNVLSFKDIQAVAGEIQAQAKR